ncbi:MAG: 50S ribosomal protein L34e [Thermoprotei archaeon]|nr:MAG: 50S ribosomal protein L34e [Thermoprotei archaeon]
MPRPAHRSRTVKRVYVRTPGGRLVVHYRRRKVSPPRCAICGRALSGFPKMTLREARKGHRPPGRPYGGCVCHECLAKALKSAVRGAYSA